MRAMLALILVTGLAAAEADALAGFPVLPRPLPVAQAAAGGEELAPGIHRQRDQFVALDGVLIIDHGPVDGLEVLACLKDGKTHEALVRLDTTHGQLIKAACIEALGLTQDGQPADEGGGIPARGTPVRLEVRWTGEDGKAVAIDASSLVRDRVTDRPYPALPYIYTGSRFLTIRGTDPQGQPINRQQFMLDSTRSVAVNFDEPDALFASPYPGAATDQRFETHSAICPPAGTRVQLVISRCVLPLELTQDATGALSAEGAVLDDAALSALLAKVYRPEAAPGLRAVGIRVNVAIERSHDLVTRSRILRLATQAGVWAVPVFVLVE